MNGARFPLILSMLMFATPSIAQTSYEDTRTPEGWALQQIKDGQVVDFDRRCGTGNPFSAAESEGKRPVIPAQGGQ
jgi:hypothetical protein